MWFTSGGPRLFARAAIEPSRTLSALLSERAGMLGSGRDGMRIHFKLTVRGGILCGRTCFWI